MVFHLLDKKNKMLLKRLLYSQALLNGVSVQFLLHIKIGKILLRAHDAGQFSSLYIRRAPS